MANILVCDDDKAIVEAIEIYLIQEGYHILKAYDGQEALDILNTEMIDLLIIDIMMPRLDGIRATVKIRESNPLPIIILSAKSEDTDKILGLNIGADGLYHKTIQSSGAHRQSEIPAAPLHTAWCCSTDSIGTHLHNRRSHSKRRQKRDPGRRRTGTPDTY